MRYEIILNGDRAEADDIGGALLAAATLAEDQADGIYGVARRLRREVTITRDGYYDGLVTQMARNGERDYMDTETGVLTDDGRELLARATIEMVDRQLEVAGAVDEASGTVYSDAEGGL